MIACLGMAAQGVMTKEGPYANLLAHLSDPVGNNLLTSEWRAAAGACATLTPPRCPVLLLAVLAPLRRASA